MRKDLLWVNVGVTAEVFHFAPYISAVDGSAASGNKNAALEYLLLCCVAEQFFLQLFYEKDDSCFSLQRHDRLAAFCRFYRYILQFADTNPRAAYRLQNQFKSFAAVRFCHSTQANILRFCKLFFFRAVDILLDSDRLRIATVPPQK